MPATVACTFLNFLAHVLVEFYESYSISPWKQGQNGLPNAPSTCISFLVAKQCTVIMAIEFSYVTCIKCFCCCCCCSEDDSQLIERVASEFNQLQFYVTQSQGHPLVESIRGVSS